VPIVASNKLVGLINVTEKEDHTPFTEGDLTCVELFGDHVAIAFERVKQERKLRGENEKLVETLRHLEGELEKHESFASIGKFAAQVAHELSNPLDGVRRFINLALDQAEEDSLSREYLIKAKKGIRQSLGVVRSMLSFSRENGKSKARQSNLHQLILNVVDQVRQDESFTGVSIDTKFCEEPIVVEECGLETAFQNLFQNARDAMNGFGTVTVATVSQHDAVEIRIRDNGCGITEDVKPRIFEAFFTTKDADHGTGLGLVISREVVERCGGKLTFESWQGKGTEFSIRIPAYKGRMQGQ